LAANKTQFFEYPPFFVLAAGIIVQIAAPRIRRSKMQRKAQSRINLGIRSLEIALVLVLVVVLDN
jgi:hypothetical protein